MDSETIQPRPYLKLLLWAALLGLISAVITFMFMALVNVGTSAVWETAAGSKRTNAPGCAMIWFRASSSARL